MGAILLSLLLLAWTGAVSFLFDIDPGLIIDAMIFVLICVLVSISTDDSNIRKEKK